MAVRVALDRLRPTAGPSRPAVRTETASISRREALLGTNTRAAALGVGAIALPGFQNGAYYPYSWTWLALAFGGVVALHLLLRERVRVSRAEELAIAALSAALLWVLLSSSWGVPGTDARHELVRGIVYLAGLGAFLLAVGRDAVRALLAGVLVAIASLVGYGLYGKVVHARPPDPFEGTLLAQPVGYANALGILAGIGILLAIGLAAEERRRLRRGLLLGAGLVCGIGLPLTSSRGAFLATTIGALLLLASHTAHSRRIRRRGTVAVAGAAVTLVILWIAASSPVPGLGDRPAYWRVALEDASRHPLLGSGAGTFDDVWALDRPIPATVHDAHSLYFEALAELGVVGFGLLAVFLVTPLVAMARSSRQPVNFVAAAAYCAYLVHAGLDWDWEYPVVTLAGIACGAALLSGARPPAGASAARGGR